MVPINSEGLLAEITAAESDEQTPSDWGVVIIEFDESDDTSTVLFKRCEDIPYFALSTAKLAVAAGLLANDLWTPDGDGYYLAAEHKVRNQSGILKHMRSGLVVSPRQAMGLMLGESDTTAMKMMIGNTDNLAAINQWLAEQGYEETELEDLSDKDGFKIGTGMTTAAEMADIMAKLHQLDIDHIVWNALQRSRFPWGVRGTVEEVHDRKALSLERKLGRQARVNGLLGTRGMQERLMNHIMFGHFNADRVISQIASKQGNQDNKVGGESNLHEVAGWELDEGLVVAAAFSRYNYLGVRGLHEHPAHWVLGYIGTVIDTYINHQA